MLVFGQKAGLTLEMSAIHQTSQAKNVPYQPLLIKLVFSLLVNAEKNPVIFQKESSSVGPRQLHFTKMVVLDKMVVSGHNDYILIGKMVVFGQKWLY